MYPSLCQLGSPWIILDPKLRSACLDGKLKTIIAILESRPEPETKLRPDIFSVMMAEAAKNNHVDVVSYCLSNGGSVTNDVIGNIADGLSFETHKFLVEEGAVVVDWHVPGHDDMLQVACLSDNLAWAKFCVHHGADVNTHSPLTGELLLAMTACVSSVAIVDLLLQHGASLHGSGAVVAAAAGRLDTLRFLLGRGANIHESPTPNPYWSIDCDLESPLHAAVVAGELEVVEYLIKEGANTSLRDSKRRTPLARARQNRNTEMVKLLLSYRSQSGRKIVGGIE